VLAPPRQNLPQLRLGYDETNRCAAGAYELVPADGAPEVSLIATGSEVSIAVEACKLLRARGIAARAVSVPCFELLRERPAAERRATGGGAKGNVAVEAAGREGWGEINGSGGGFVGGERVCAAEPLQG